MTHALPHTLVRGNDGSSGLMDSLLAESAIKTDSVPHWNNAGKHFKASPVSAGDDVCCANFKHNYKHILMSHQRALTVPHTHPTHKPQIMSLEAGERAERLQSVEDEIRANQIIELRLKALAAQVRERVHKREREIESTTAALYQSLAFGVQSKH